METSRYMASISRYSLTSSGQQESLNGWMSFVALKAEGRT